MSTRKRTCSCSLSSSPVTKSPRHEVKSENRTPVAAESENRTPVVVTSESSGDLCTADTELGADASKREVIILVGYPSAGKTTLAR